MSRSRRRWLLEAWGLGGLVMTMGVGVLIIRSFVDAGRSDLAESLKYVVLGIQVAFAAAFLFVLFLRERRAKGRRA